MTGAHWIREATFATRGFDRWYLIADGVPEDEAESTAWASVEYLGWGPAGAKWS